MEPENRSPFFFKCRMKLAGKELSSRDEGHEEVASVSASDRSAERTGCNGHVIETGVGLHMKEAKAKLVGYGIG